MVEKTIMEWIFYEEGESMVLLYNETDKLYMRLLIYDRLNRFNVNEVPEYMINEVIDDCCIYASHYDFHDWDFVSEFAWCYVVIFLCTIPWRRDRKYPFGNINWQTTSDAVRVYQDSMKKKIQSNFSTNFCLG